MRTRMHASPKIGALTAGLCVIKTCNQETAALTFWPMSIVIKQLDGSTCHLAWTMDVHVGPDHIVLDGNQAPP